MGWYPERDLDWCLEWDEICNGMVWDNIWVWNGIWDGVWNGMIIICNGIVMCRQSRYRVYGILRIG